jgi:hypothetical protein
MVRQADDRHQLVMGAWTWELGHWELGHWELGHWELGHWELGHWELGPPSCSWDRVSLTTSPNKTVLPYMIRSHGRKGFSLSRRVSLPVVASSRSRVQKELLVLYY